MAILEVRSLVLPALVLALVAGALPGAAGDDPGPRRAIVDVEVRADPTHLYFDVTLNDTVPASEPGQVSFQVDFGVQSREERQAGAGTSRSYTISLGSSTSPDEYILWNNASGVRTLGTVVDPGVGSDTITFPVERDDARPYANDPAEAGDAVVDVRAAYLLNETPASKATADDFVIPSSVPSGDLDLHLSAYLPLVGPRRLAEAGPGPDARERTDALYGNEHGAVRFASEPLDDALRLEAGTVRLWMSFTTTTPNVAVNFPNAVLSAVTPTGERLKLAERASYVGPGNPNVFTTPGVPHEMTWSLTFLQRDVPAGSVLELEVRSQGLFDQGAQGPHILYYNSTAHDSSLHLDASPLEEGAVGAGVPLLGTFGFHLDGASGHLDDDRPPDQEPEPVPAAGDNQTTLARWTSDPLAVDVPLQSAEATVWLSSVTASRLAALNFVDAQLFRLRPDGTETLVAQRETVAEGGNPNLFVLPAEPREFTWPLATYADGLDAGDRLEVRVTAEALPGLAPTTALVWGNGTAMDSSLILRDAPLAADVTPNPTPVDEEANFTAEIPAGETPYNVSWDFGDGNATSFETTHRNVTVRHAYDATGRYEARLVVRDAAGKADAVDVPVDVFDPGNVTRLEDVTADPHLPTLGTLRFTWTSDAPGNTTVHLGTSPDDLNRTVEVDENVTDHAVNVTELRTGTTYHYRVQTGDLVGDLRNATTAPDLRDDGHTVVAVVDTGINPYHQAFRRPALTAHPATFLTGFPPGSEPLELTFDAGTYHDAVAADGDVWDAVDPLRTYWVPGTNVIARDHGDASFVNAGEDEEPILDDDGHGTSTAGTVLQAHPDAFVVAVESTRNGALTWAASQPWIDVISLSFGSPAFGPLFEVSEAVQLAQRNGKMLVVSAGNQPTPQVLFRPGGYPQAVSVGGHHPETRSDAFIASKNPDVVSNFTVSDVPQAQSLDARGSATGTSFSAPNVAGTLAAALEALREDVGDTEEDTRTGLVNLDDPAAGSAPYLDDGALTNHELRDAVNRTAEYWDTTEYDPFSPFRHPISVAVPVAPGAPWVQQGWGYVGPRLADDMAAAASGDAHPTKPAPARAYMEAHQEVRRNYHQPPGRHVDEDTLLNDVSAPGARVDVVPLDEPVETPHPYPNDAQLDYLVEAPGAEAIALHFVNFSVETGFDAVIVHGHGGHPRGAYTLDGQASFWTPHYPGDTLRVTLVSDAHVQRHGFEIPEIDVVR